MPVTKYENTTKLIHILTLCTVEAPHPLCLKNSLIFSNNHVFRKCNWIRRHRERSRSALRRGAHVRRPRAQRGDVVLIQLRTNNHKNNNRSVSRSRPADCATPMYPWPTARLVCPCPAFSVTRAPEPLRASEKVSRTGNAATASSSRLYVQPE